MKLVNKLVAVACAWNSAGVFASDRNLRGSNEVDAIDILTEEDDKREPLYFQGTLDHMLQNNGATVVDPVDEDLNFDEEDRNFVAVHPHHEDHKLVVGDTNGSPTNSTSSRQGSSRQGLNGATITIGRTPTTPSTFSNAMGGDSGDNDNDHGSSTDDNDNDEDGPGCVPPSPPAPCPAGQIAKFRPEDCSFFCLSPGSGGDDRDRKLVLGDITETTNSTSPRQGSSRQGHNRATITIGRTPTTPSTFSNAMGGDSGDNDNDNGNSTGDNDNDEDGPGCIPPSPPAPCPAGQIAKFRPEDCSFFCLSPGSGGDDRDRKLVLGDIAETTNSTSPRQGLSSQGLNGATITIGRTPTTPSTFSNAMEGDSGDNDNDNDSSLDDNDNDEDGPGCIPPSPPAPCPAGQIAKFRPEDCTFFCLSPGSGGDDRI